MFDLELEWTVRVGGGGGVHSLTPTPLSIFLPMTAPLVEIFLSSKPSAGIKIKNGGHNFCQENNSFARSTGYAYAKLAVRWKSWNVQLSKNVSDGELKLANIFDCWTPVRLPLDTANFFMIRHSSYRVLKNLFIRQLWVHRDVKRLKRFREHSRSCSSSGSYASFVFYNWELH